LSHWKVFRGSNTHGAVIFHNSNTFLWNTYWRTCLMLF
jgi:hypothetical protein